MPGITDILERSITVAFGGTGRFAPTALMRPASIRMIWLGLAVPASGSISRPALMAVTCARAVTTASAMKRTRRKIGIGSLTLRDENLRLRSECSRFKQIFYSLQRVWIDPSDKSSRREYPRPHLKRAARQRRRHLRPSPSPHCPDRRARASSRGRESDH